MSSVSSSSRVATPLQCDNARLAIINATDIAGKLGINVTTKIDLLAITSGDKPAKEKFAEVVKAVADIFDELRAKIERGYPAPSKTPGASDEHVKGVCDYKKLAGSELEIANMKAKNSLGMLKQRENPKYSLEDREQIRTHSVKTRVEADAVKAKSDLAAKALETETDLKITTEEFIIAAHKRSMDLALKTAEDTLKAAGTEEEKTVAAKALETVKKDADTAAAKAHQEITKLKSEVKAEKAKFTAKAKTEYDIALKGGYRSVAETQLDKIKTDLEKLFAKANEVEQANEGLARLAAQVEGAVKFYQAIHIVPANVQIVRDFEASEMNKELDSFYKANEQRYNTLVQIFEDVNNLRATCATRPGEVRVNISKLQEVVKNDGKSIATSAAALNWFWPAKEAVKLPVGSSSIPATAAV